MVMGINSWWRGHEFESQHGMLDGRFFTFVGSKIVLLISTNKTRSGANLINTLSSLNYNFIEMHARQFSSQYDGNLRP